MHAGSSSFCVYSQSTSACNESLTYTPGDEGRLLLYQEQLYMYDGQREDYANNDHTHSRYG